MLLKRDHKIEVQICSEAIFSSGEKERNLVQSRVLADRYGLVYLHAKTLKGQLKRQAFWLLRQYQSFDDRRAETFLDSVIQLFGINSMELEMIKLKGVRNFSSSSRQGIMKLSPLELDKRLRNYFIALQEKDARDKYYRISPHDLIEAQTHIRTGIQLEDGRTKDKRLTTYHTVKEGLVFYSSLSFDIDPTDYLADLQRIVHSLERIGAGIHRGRGQVAACLLVDGEEATYVKCKDKGGE